MLDERLKADDCCEKYRKLLLGVTSILEEILGLLLGYLCV